MAMAPEDVARSRFRQLAKVYEKTTRLAAELQVPVSIPELGPDAPEWERAWWRRRHLEEGAA